ncbi:MAG: hypothetical protein MR747_08545, partial [Bacteroidales bacterium]|nr:hypothetical protein [Bacteroidales bacterium]
PTQTVSTQKSVFPKTGKTPLSPSFFSKKTPLALKNPPKTRIFSVLSKYHVPTGFGFSPKASGFYVFCFGAPSIYPLNLT